MPSAIKANIGHSLALPPKAKIAALATSMTERKTNVININVFKKY